MSIDDRVRWLIQLGELVSYKPTTIKPGEITRTLLITKEMMPWCFPVGTHHDPRVKDDHLAQAHDQFNAFVRGYDMEEDLDLKWLDPRVDEVFAIRTYLKRPQLRFLGWFLRPGQFVIANAKVRDDLELVSGPEWDAAIQCVVDVRDTLMPGIRPFSGVKFSDYVD